MPPKTETPIELFESLTIVPSMNPTTIEVRSRAIEVRDILSSFDRHILPSEFKPQIFAELDRPSNSRPPTTQWTIQEDLPATLLQWGAYDDQAYKLLTSLQTSSILSRCYYEKIGRRFKDLFDEYDHLPDGDHRRIRSEIQRIAGGFRDIVAAVKDDRAHRQLGEEPVASRLLDAVISVCRRHTNLVVSPPTPSSSRRSTRHSNSSSTEGASNLFDALIKSPAGDQTSSLFMLDVLETFPGTIFTSLESEYSNLMSLLDINDAPAPYKYRVGRLPSLSATAATHATGSSSESRHVDAPIIPTLSHELSASPTVTSEIQSPTSTAGPSQSQAQTGPSTTTGSKRSAEDTGPMTKRGRRKPK